MRRPWSGNKPGPLGVQRRGPLPGPCAGRSGRKRTWGWTAARRDLTRQHLLHLFSQRFARHAALTILLLTSA